MLCKSDTLFMRSTLLFSKCSLSAFSISVSSRYSSSLSLKKKPIIVFQYFLQQKKLREEYGSHYCNT
jgi:hypothetical protein